MKRALALLIVPLLLLAGCNNPQSKVDRLRQEISDFRDAPTDDKKAQIEEGLAKLQRQVDEMQARGDLKADEYSRKLATLESDYQAARMGKAFQDAKEALQGFGQAIQQGAKSIEESFHKGSTNK